MMLSLPGASYLAGLVEIDKQNLSTFATVLTVLAFNIIMLALLEIPLLGFVVDPDWTSRTIARFRAWVNRSGGRILEVGAVRSPLPSSREGSARSWAHDKNFCLPVPRSRQTTVRTALRLLRFRGD